MVAYQITQHLRTAFRQSEISDPPRSREVVSCINSLLGSAVASRFSGASLDLIPETHQQSPQTSASRGEETRRGGFDTSLLLTSEYQGLQHDRACADALRH